MIYSPLDECFGTTLKSGSLAKSEVCASVNGLDDRFLTYLALMSSGAGETGFEDVVAVFVELMRLEDDLEVAGFE